MRYNHETLKSKFVKFDGKKELSVRTDGFVKGEQNPWTEVFSKFSEQIKENIGEENHEALIQEFTTTNPLSKAIHEMSLMNAM